MILFIKICIVAFLLYTIVKIYQKTKKTQREHIISLTVFSKVWLIFAVIGIVCYLFFGFLPTITEKKIIIDIVLLAFIVFLCILSVLFCRWHIDIDDERIDYCSLTGKSKCCRLNEIMKAEIDEKGNICIYSENENAWKIPSEIGNTYLITALKLYGIDVKYKHKIDDFEMKLPLFYPVMYLCFFIIAGLFAVFSMKYYIFAGLFWLVLTVASAYKSVSDLKDRVIVKNNMIIQTRFLRKTRKLKYGQVIKVMRRIRDNAPYFYIYSEKGLEMKINMLCENRDLLEEVVKKHHWEINESRIQKKRRH